MTTHRNHAWAGPMEALVSTPQEALLARLIQFVPDAGRAQVHAWKQELEVLQGQGAEVIELQPSARDHGTVLEYMLPREAGRRPDVVVLQNGRVVVVEFKESGRLRRADLDQVAAYARDLAGYHSACEHQEVIPLLVLCGSGAPERVVDGVRVVPAAHLGATLVELARGAEGAPPDLPGFLAGEYAPLPTLVSAARLLFENLGLPFVKRARSAGVHDAVERILGESREVRAEGGLRLVLLTGVPGSGKTLVGLQVAHSAALEEGFRFGLRRSRGAPATFLSGNGPLVQVLQNALKSTAFVQDMHRFIREYGLERPDRVPLEHVVVFDEAQRAWDRDKIVDFYTKKLPGQDPAAFASEPELLARIAGRIDGGALVVALVGEGQEIHTGEEGGMEQWAEAVARSDKPWRVVGPPALAPLFRQHRVPFAADAVLDLDTGLRYHAAADLHEWVRLVLDDGRLDDARELAQRLRREAFPIYVTRDLEAAKDYARSRFAGEPLRRYGLLASSKARNLEPHGLDSGFQATKRIRIGDWFNAEPEQQRSCCQFTDVVTEFQCQGLELDLAVVCWGDDFWWDRAETRWVGKEGRRQRLVKDPLRLRTNAYRVLLTRGREGTVIFVPPGPAARMDATFEALLTAGAVEARAVPGALAG